MKWSAKWWWKSSRQLVALDNLHRRVGRVRSGVEEAAEKYGGEWAQFIAATAAIDQSVATREKGQRERRLEEGSDTMRRR